MAKIYWVSCPHCGRRYYVSTLLRGSGKELECPFCHRAFPEEAGRRAEGEREACFLKSASRCTAGALIHSDNRRFASRGNCLLKIVKYTVQFSERRRCWRRGSADRRGRPSAAGPPGIQSLVVDRAGARGALPAVAAGLLLRCPPHPRTAPSTPCRPALRRPQGREDHDPPPAGGALSGRGLAPERILYASFDHPILKLISLEALLDVYRVHISGGASEGLLLLDEVHYAADWATRLKLLVDRHSGYRIVATGSARARLEVEGGESGAGRWTDLLVPPLSFYEYLQIRGIEEVPALPRELDPTAIAALPEDRAQSLLSRCAPLEPYLPRYLLVGGFPETASADDLFLAQRLFREDIVDRVLKRDMTALYGIRNVLDLERLFVYLCLHTGSLLALDTVARELGVSRAKVANDLLSLELAHLIYRSDPVDIRGKRMLKARSKVYMADPALRNAVLLKGDEVLADPEEMGLIVETAVYSHLHGYFHAERARIGHWRDRTGQFELDIVVAGPTGPAFAAEVKYRESPGITSRSGLSRFLSEVPGVPAFVITKRSRDFGTISSTCGRCAGRQGRRAGVCRRSGCPPFFSCMSSVGPPRLGRGRSEFASPSSALV